MPRQVRIQYQGATYHIMSRGDQYEAIFLTDNDRKNFLKTLGEVCKSTGWVVHSYVLMSNHFHWLLETPEANLVEGMRWFLSTYTKRFNGRNKLVGHVFQGRYKSLLINPENFEYFQFVSNYIHLNPARAGLLDPQTPNLNQYKWCSYQYFLKPRDRRPVWLKVDKVFKGLDILKDNAAGRKNYAHYMELALRELLDPKKLMQFEEKWNKIRRGWYLGDDTFKEKLLKHAQKILKGKRATSHSGDLKKEHNENTANQLIQNAFKILNFQESDLEMTKKNDSRKQTIAWLVKTRTMVRNQWIANRLLMGDPSSVGHAVKTVNETKNRFILSMKKKLEKYS